MSCFLSIECSTEEGSLALAEAAEFRRLGFKKWTQKSCSGNSSDRHSARLALEIKNIFESSGRKLSELKFIAVGAGPGRWTGVRLAVNSARALAFSLNIPVCPVHSLKVAAEAFLPNPLPVFSAVNAFKNQVYFSEFHPDKKKEERLRLLSFEDWKVYMLKQAAAGKKPLCLSDLDRFYLIPESLKQAFCFKKHKPSALQLAQIAFRQKNRAVSWKKLKAFYLRSPAKL